jgi:hypothetical protein
MIYLQSTKLRTRQPGAQNKKTPSKLNRSVCGAQLPTCAMPVPKNEAMTPVKDKVTEVAEANAAKFGLSPISTNLREPNAARWFQNDQCGRKDVGSQQETAPYD